MTYYEILDKFEIHSQSTPNQAQVRCPAHEDKQASLTVSYKEDKILLYCHAGCSHHDILKVIGLNESDLFNSDKTEIKPPKKSKKTSEEKIAKSSKEKIAKSSKEEKITKKLVATYYYTDLEGNIKHFTNRYKLSNGSKEFSQGHYDDQGNKVYSVTNIQLYLYNLPALMEAIQNGNTVYVVEGEKDVESLAKIGLVATSNVGGGGKGKWKKDYNVYFQGANVVILCDNDATGRQHGWDVYDNIKDIANSVEVVTLPDLPEKGDVSDYLDNNKSKDDLLKDIDLVIKKNLERSESMKNATDTIRKANDKKEECEYATEYIYEKGKIIHVRVLDMLHKYHNLKTSVIKGKRKYFKYSDGYWKEIDKDSLGLYFFDYFDETDKTSRNVVAVTNIINSDVRFVVDEQKWNSERTKINLRNCTFDLKNYKSIPHSPDHYFTYKNDYDFNLSATCPEFDKSLIEYSKTRDVPDPNWINRFWEIAGYCMLGIMPYQVMFWFIGNSGRNGKGTLIRIIEALVGDFLTVSGIDTRDFRERFFMGRFIGKNLATAGDLHNHLTNVSILKSLSGGDKQTTDVKFGDTVSFTNNAKFIFAMNTIPSLPANETIKPIAKRIVPLQFNHNILEPNSEIEDIFMSELSGIFNKAILGLIDLIENRGRFTPVANADNWLKNWAEKRPPMQEFLERYVYDPDSKGIFLKDVFNEYEYAMKDFYGTNWLNEPSIKVKGSRKLKEAIVDDIERRYHVIINSDTAYSHSEGGKMTILRYLTDTHFLPNEIGF